MEQLWLCSKRQWECKSATVAVALQRSCGAARDGIPRIANVIKKQSTSSNSADKPRKRGDGKNIKLLWWRHCSSTCRTASEKMKKNNNQPAATVPSKPAQAWHNGNSVTIVARWQQHCSRLRNPTGDGVQDFFKNNNQPAATVPARKAMATSSQHSNSGTVA